MTFSIRARLTISLTVGIVIIWVITTLADTFIDSHEIKKHQKQGLIYTSSLINAFIEQEDFPTSINAIDNLHFKNVIFQLWDKNNHLILRSNNAPLIPITHINNGFSQTTFHDEPWEVYTKSDSKTGVRTIVATSLTSTNQLSKKIVANNIYFMLLALAILIIFINYTIHYSLRYIRKLTNELTNRAATHLEPIKVAEMPKEFNALLTELNKLFAQIREALLRNKRFASDAAHELRTPLAALKTQAEVALKVKTDKERNTALRHVISGVDRSTHVVEQLLTLGRLAPEATLNDIIPVNLEKLAAEMIALLVPQALKKNIDIELNSEIHDLTVLGNEVSLAILMRNLIDNAIRYTPENGMVKAFILKKNHDIIFRVEDNGPGIPKQLHERIFERFFRVLGTKTTGSGLGLAIVKQIVDLHKAQIILGKPDKGPGLRVDIVFTTHPPAT